MNNADVINYISSSFQLGVRTHWRWHRHAKMCWSGDRPYFCV